MKRFAIVATLIAFAGCSSFDLKEGIPWSKKDKPEFACPHRMVAIWTDTVLHTAGKPSTRGFGGRIYFYDQVSKPVAVDGTLVVYAYDDSQGGSITREPDRRFVFRPEDFVKHADETQLGQSYSVWLPWDNLGGFRTEITLIPMFTTKEGDVVSGQPSKHLLSGKDPPSGEYYQPPHASQAGMAPMPQSYAQQASFEMPAIQSDMQRQLRTMSIPMTDSLKQRLIESGDVREPAPYHLKHPETTHGGNLRSTGSVPTNDHEASLRTSRGGDLSPNGGSSNRPHLTPGEVYRTETARVTAAWENAVEAQQRAASWGSNRESRPLGQPSSHFARQRSPVPEGATARPFPGPAHWQRPRERQPFDLPAQVAASPLGSLPANASNVVPPLH